MTTYDLSPLLRATIGFDRLMGLLDASGRAEAAAPGYPPYNIEKESEDSYRITMAVAGFSEDELTITLSENALLIEGKKQKEEKPQSYLHRGIATRSFQRSFQLADHIKVASAQLENGLLHIGLVREVPEAMKTKRIPITMGAAPAGLAGKSKSKLIEGKAA